MAALAREHKPKLIVAGASAYPREIPHGKFAEIAREVGAKLFVDMAHYAGPGGGRACTTIPVPVADFVTTTTHKTLRGPRGGMILCKAEYAKDIDRSVFPGIQGGPLMHVIAGKAVCFGEALRPDFKQYARQIIDNAKALAEALLAGGVRLVSGGTDNHLMLVDVTPLGLGGKQAEAALGPLRHHGQQEHDPLRPAQADGPLGHPHRHAGLDHARHGRRRNEAHRRLDAQRAQGARRRQAAHDDPRRGVRPVRAVPRARRAAGRGRRKPAIERGTASLGRSWTGESRLPRSRAAEWAVFDFQIATPGRWHFRLPVRPYNRGCWKTFARGASPRMCRCRLSKSRILIADDNGPNVELLEAYLGGLDCEIAVAVDGRDTLDKVAAFQPDLILLDIMMPKLSGFEVCEKLKAIRPPGGS